MAWLMNGDCVQMMKAIPSGVVDSVVCDPPYGLSFMGKKWDYDVPGVDVWAECLRVLKPGGHLLAFAGTRTQHRMAVRIEDAGFEIRDMIAWVYGGGFPKSLDVSKAIDKAAGAEREVVGFDAAAAKRTAAIGTQAYGDFKGQSGDITAAATDAAREWQGWGTALKPALEPITVARKPFPGTVADNVQAYRTGALNIDGCRVPAMDGYVENAVTQGINTARTSYEHRRERRTFEPSKDGRWPANLIHDGSPEVLAGFPESSITGKRSQSSKAAQVAGTQWLTGNHQSTEYTDSGSAARFFYVPKASKADRDAGLYGLEPQRADPGALRDGDSREKDVLRKNNHPTVKPTDLMRYLCRLVTPPGGVVLDPFMGSGSTGRAACLEGFQFIGVERDPGYFEIAKRRVEG